MHEHWNNPEQRMYSRNLGTGKGIELYRVPLDENRAAIEYFMQMERLCTIKFLMQMR